MKNWILTLLWKGFNEKTWSLNGVELVLWNAFEWFMRS